MKTIICILLLLTVAPVTAVTSLALIAPDDFGGPPTVETIMIMSMFGLITLPLWLTYFPALVGIPILMTKISRIEGFYEIRIRDLVILSFLVGGVAGLVILIPIWIAAAMEGAFRYVVLWCIAGFFSGGITMVLISALYRFGGRSMAQPGAVGNEGHHRAD